MNMVSPDLAAVLRLSDVALAREALEAALQIPLDRFKVARKGDTHYAQINLPERASWEQVIAFAERIGPTLQSLLQRGRLGRASLDIALHMQEGFVSASIHIPHSAAETIGRFGIDLEIPAYLTAPD